MEVPKKLKEINTKESNSSRPNCSKNKEDFSSGSMSRRNPNYPPWKKKGGDEFLKHSPMKLAREQQKDKELGDFSIRSRSQPDETISKVIVEKTDRPFVKTSLPTKLKTNFVGQSKDTKAQYSKVGLSNRNNPVEQVNKYYLDDDDDNDGWITVKSNKSNLKKDLGYLPVTSNNKYRNKLISQEKKPGSYNFKNFNTANKEADIGKNFQELKPNSSNRNESDIHNSNNFGIGVSTQYNLHGLTPCDSNRKIIQNKPFNRNKEESSAYSKDRPIGLPIESSEMSKENEEKIKAKLARKKRIKEEKKRKREDEARLLRENLGKDTKVNVISQEMIEMFSKAAGQDSVSYNYRHYRASYSEEYPAIGLSVNESSKQHFQNRPIDKIWPNQFQRPEIKNRPIKKKNINSWEESKISSPSYSSARSNTEDKLLDSSKLTLDSSHFEEDAFEVKKKVKSKDRMNLAIMSLLEMKQREKKKDGKTKIKIEQKPVKPIIERHGKIRENSKKKLSVLKKNILREKKLREELLISLLKENFPVAAETSVCEKTLVLPDDTDPNSSTASIASPLVNNVQDTGGPALSLSIEKCYESSKSSKILSKDLSNGKISSSDSKSLVNISESQDLTQQKIENSSIIKEINILMNPVHSKKFREYCDQIVTPEINAVLSELIQLLVKFQDRLYQLDPMKAKIKRRFYCGLKESMKHMNRQVCIIMAPNLKPSPGPGCVDELVMKVLNKAAECGIPIVFGLTNRIIGRLCHKKVPVSCFSIVNYQGAQESFIALMDLVPEAKREYQELLSSRGLTDGGQGDFEGKGSSKENITSNEITDSLLLSLKTDEKIV